MPPAARRPSTWARSRKTWATLLRRSAGIAARSSSSPSTRMHTSIWRACWRRRDGTRRRRFTGAAISSSTPVVRGLRSRGPTSKAAKARSRTNENTAERWRWARECAGLEARAEPAGYAALCCAWESGDRAVGRMREAEGQRHRAAGSARRAGADRFDRRGTRAAAVDGARRSLPRRGAEDLRPEQGGGASRELEGVRQGSHDAPRYPDRALRQLHRRRGGPTLLSRVG